MNCITVSKINLLQRYIFRSTNGEELFQLIIYHYQFYIEEPDTHLQKIDMWILI